MRPSVRIASQWRRCRRPASRLRLPSRWRLSLR